jgi:DNA repair protein RAD5
VSHFEDLQNAGEDARYFPFFLSLFSSTDSPSRLEQARCPVCSSGPLSERDIAAIENADGTRPSSASTSASTSTPRKRPKKTGYAIENVGASSSPGGSLSAGKEVLTILSSDEDDEPDSPVKKKAVSSVKGKGKESAKKSSPKKKKKVEEITLDSSDEDESDDGSTYDDSDAPSDSFLPASRRRTAKRRGSGEKDSEGDDEMGELSNSEEEDNGAPLVDTKGEAEGARKKALLLAKGDFRGSAKLEALVEAVKEAKRKDGGLKAVVFSQVRPFLPP